MFHSCQTPLIVFGEEELVDMRIAEELKQRQLQRIKKVKKIRKPNSQRSLIYFGNLVKKSGKIGFSQNQDL